MTKDELRKRYLLIRKNITNKDEKSLVITNKIINDNWFKKSKIIGLYMNLPNEVDTSMIIDYTLNLGKIVALPKVENNNLKFYKIDSNSKYEKSNFNIYEPISNESIESLDLIIIPGVCFDRNNNRIGFGKGYYDRYLYNKNIKKIGICFEEQITNDIIDIDEYDIKIDKVISDGGSYVKRK